MNKITPTKPVLICLYGFPGSGKSYLARNLNSHLQLAHVSADRIRSELFQKPRYDVQENAVIAHLMNYMSEEFLNAGVSVVYDTNSVRTAQRHKLRELARKNKAAHLLIWLQVDRETAYSRTQIRDRRTSDDKFAQPQTQTSFENELNVMQNPNTEEYLVVSGKHTFVTQKSAIMTRLFNMGLISSGTVQSSVTKPGLVNLVPNLQAGRVDPSRRNISVF